MANLPIIILGCSGHCKVLIDALVISKKKIIGIACPDLKKNDTYYGQKVIGNDDEILKYNPDEIELVVGVGQIHGCSIRKRLLNLFTEKQYKFASIIHPASTVSPSVVLSEGVQIMANTVIQADSKIGSHVIVNTGATIDHDCVIGDFSHLAPGVTLSGNVKIGKNCHIGTGTSIIQNITIGDNCLIAAGSVVYQNIESDTKLIQKKT